MEFHDNVSLLNHDEIIRKLENCGYKCSLDFDGKTTFGYLFARRK